MVKFLVSYRINQTNLYHPMKKLEPTDYVIYDRANDHVIQFEDKGDIVIFGVKSEAEADCRGNEEVIPCTELPTHQQEILIAQINKE